MGILKGFALGLLSFLLFLSLTIFGFAYTVNSTVLNPDFISSQLDRLDVSSLVNEIMTEQMAEEDFPEELLTAMVDTIDKLEAPVKQQVSAATHDTFDYLLGKKASPDLAATLGDTFLNSDFVASLMAELDLAALAEEVVSQQTSEEGLTEEMGNAIVSTITELEPTIKQKVPAASEPIFDYLLGKTESIDLVHTLRSTILTSDFFVTLLEGLDISALLPESLGEQRVEELPEELSYLSEYVDDAIAALEPTIREEVKVAADPVLDYLLGERESLSIVISLEPVIESLEDSLREAFLKSPPPDYADLSPSELNQLFDLHFAELTGNMPSTIELTEALFPPELTAQITDALVEAENGLEQARQAIAEAIADAEARLEQAREYVSWFQLGYYILIGLLALLVLAIILINHEVKGATRGLGITCLTYGAIEALGLFLTKNLATTQLAGIEIPSVFQGLMVQFLNDFLAPLQMLSIGLAVAGAVLIVASFVYPRLRPTSSWD